MLRYWRAELPRWRSTASAARTAGESASRATWAHTPWSESGLVAHLTRKGFTGDELVDAGLALRFADGRMLDRFRHRLMLASRDPRGRFIGFYGRATSANPSAAVPKYLNTPTTVVFDKSRAL